MARVFISYQRSDTQQLAHCLRYALLAAGHEPFVDTGAIPAGTAFMPFIDESLARTDLVLTLIGPAFDHKRLRQPTSAVAFEWRRARFYGCAILPVLYQIRSMVPADELPGELRWWPALNVGFIADESLSGDSDALVALVPVLARPPRPSAHVLWIDDNPKNNVTERRHLRESGISFDNVVSTDQAFEQLRNSSYDLVISDLGRFTKSEKSNIAGLESLRFLSGAAGPPLIVYAGPKAAELRDEIIRRGAFGSTDKPHELYVLVEQALGRSAPADTVLER